MSNTNTVDPSARLHPSVTLGKNVVIGPFCSIAENSSVGDGTVLKSHVAIGPNTSIGCNNTFYPHSAVGGDPQDLQWHGEETFLVMGDRNVVRESATINRGTPKGDGCTRVGNGNLLMACSHIAHDCVLGDHVVLANNALLAGHVVVEDRATLNGSAAVHQFTTIGRLAYVGGLTRIVQDVPPFMIVEGHPSKVRKVNVVGLQRNGFSAERIAKIKAAYRAIFRASGLRSEILAELEADANESPEVNELVEFLLRVDRGRHGRSRNV
ncbi:MAG: acyl-ACP--UDP-N-acetylglucosamine O-acyltransferase [Planctomycetota bacterium]